MIHKYCLKKIELVEFSLLILFLVNDMNSWYLSLGQVSEILVFGILKFIGWLFLFSFELDSNNGTTNNTTFTKKPSKMHKTIMKMPASKMI